MASSSVVKPREASLLPVKPASGRKTVRWYIMFFPFGKKGLTLGLEQELSRRRRLGEKAFEYFAPTYTAAHEADGRLVRTEESLLYNYFFIHTTEDDLFVLKRHQPQYSVLRRVSDSDGSYHYPYVSDETIRTLQWIARSYGGNIPLCLLDQSLLLRGDRIRITKGRFKGIEAHLVNHPKTSTSDVMVFVDNWLCVPLMNVRATEYEVIGINDKSPKTQTSSGLDNSRYLPLLHEALCRFHRGEMTESDGRLAEEVYRLYADVKVETSIQRCKLYSLLLPACTLLGKEEKLDSLLALARLMLPQITAEQSLALLLVTLYGCTDNAAYYEQSHRLLSPWQQEPSPKKSKQTLLTRLADYDRCLGHEAALRA